MEETSAQKIPRQDNRKIIKTMESVIESVKKKRKYRKKHHKIDETAETEILIISDAISHNLSIISPNASLDESSSINNHKIINGQSSKEIINSVKDEKCKRNEYNKHSLKNKKRNKKELVIFNSKIEKSSTDNKSPIKNGLSSAHDNDVAIIKSKEFKKPEDSTSSNKVNAFEIMMNARNRSIGSNSPGKELEIDDNSEQKKQNKSLKEKRKQLLQNWADKKGGTKRRLEDKAREEYIEHKMEKRAKRLKRMLVNGSNLPLTKSKTVKNQETKRRVRKSKHHESVEDKIQVVDNDEQLERENNENLEKIPILNSTSKIDKVEKTKADIIQISSTDEFSDIQQNGKNNSIEEDFTHKLSSPIKKRDSLLGYFPKIVSSTSATTTEEVTIVKSILNSSDDFESNKKVIKTKVTTIRKKRRSSQKNVDCIPIPLSPSTSPPLDTDFKQKISKKVRKSYQKVEKIIDETDIDKKMENSKESKKQRKKMPINENYQNEDRSIEIIEEPENNASTPLTLSGRPKRSCAGKARYDYDLAPSPTKVEKKTSKRQRHDSMQTEDDLYTPPPRAKKRLDTSICVISVEDESTSSIISNSEKIPQKLAPIFVKALPKPVIDPEIVKARQKFLMSGVPEKMKLEMEKQKQFEQSYEISTELFPITGHIHQLEESLNNKSLQLTIANAIDWNEYGVVWRSQPTEISPQKNEYNNMNNDFKYISNERKFLPPLQPLQKIENKQLFIKHLKNVYDKFPTYRCYNQLREKYRYFSAIDSNLETHQITDSLVVTKILKNHKTKCSLTNTDEDGYDEDKPPPTAPNGELLFTEKYKPILSEQVLVNLSPVNQLKEFLSSWQNRKNMKMGSDTSMSDIDFENDSSGGSSNGNLNTVVLVGPSSSGKTNAVFAIANELNFNVLEINAGMKRTGKKILQELQEATQSHQVGKDGGNNLLKQSFNNGIRKKSQQNNDNSSSLENNNFNEKLSLILIEDADIIFEQDNGFIEAINQLSAISKRPVVITANNPNCQHLLKLISQHSIEFSSPNVLNISKFLSILSLIENCPIELDDIISLYLYNQKNLRKTLLEMQFFIQSGGDRIINNKNNLNENNKENKFISSPRKFSTEELFEINQNTENHDDDIKKERKQINENKLESIYMHKTLFDFYTSSQNRNWRIPLPLNYNLLWTNLKDIFNVSNNLKMHNKFCNSSVSKTKSLDSMKYEKFKSKSHEINELHKNVNANKINCCDNLISLSEFYENISIAAYISPVNYFDRQHTNILEDISHCLAESAIEINLKANKTAYNLFEPQKERLCLTSYIPSNNTTIHSNRSLQLDYESCLRSICRSEKSRQIEKRLSRSYHYLRNICTSNLNSFSSKLFEKSCEIFLTNSNRNGIVNDVDNNDGENSICTVTVIE